MACGCPTGYVFNALTGLCEKKQQSLVNNGPGDSFPNTSFCKNRENLSKGTVIYPNIVPSQFPLVGQSSINPTFIDAQSSVITPASVILSGNLWTSGGLNTDGRLNQAGVGLLTPLNIWQGWMTCITVQSGDIMSVAFSAQKAFRLLINGVLAIIHQPSLPAKVNEHLHIFPLVLPAGSYTFQYEGLSDTTNLCEGGSIPATNNGAFVFEIYKNASATILSGLNTQSALGAYYVSGGINWPLPYVTTLLLGTTQFYTGPIGLFNCTTGYLDYCSIPGNAVCQTLLTQPFVNCCFNLINCETGAIIKTNTNLNAYLGKIITVTEFTGCFLVNSLLDPICTGGVSVTVLLEFTTCAQCTKKCYLLVDCLGISPSIIVDNDFSLILNKVIKIDSQPGICWLVTPSTTCVGSQTVSVTINYDTCALCLALPVIPVIPLKTRKVLPGYGTEFCSVEYVEKINCKFSDQVYARMIQKKYGVEQCIEDEFNKYLIKKLILDFNLVYDPTACVAPVVPDVCPVIPIIPPVPITCPAVTSVTSTIVLAIVDCPTASNVSSSITYQLP